MKSGHVFMGLVICAALACKKEEPAPAIIGGELSHVQLIFPLKNSECNVGTDSAGTVSTIKFEWRAEGEPDEYELNITNLFTSEASAYTTAVDTFSAVLPRATPFSWFVIAGSDTSDVWKFYNSGDGVASYAPFPADIVFPAMSENITAPSGSITLQWEGADVDDDISGYDVYFGLENPPPRVAEYIPQSELSGVSVEVGNIYYWSVTTRDEHGHESESGVFQFKVD